MAGSRQNMEVKWNVLARQLPYDLSTLKASRSHRKHHNQGFTTLLALAVWGYICSLRLAKSEKNQSKLKTSYKQSYTTYTPHLGTYSSRNVMVFKYSLKNKQTRTTVFPRPPPAMRSTCEGLNSPTSVIPSVTGQGRIIVFDWTDQAGSWVTENEDARLRCTKMYLMFY